MYIVRHISMGDYPPEAGVTHISSSLFLQIPRMALETNGESSNLSSPLASPLYSEVWQLINDDTAIHTTRVSRTKSRLISNSVIRSHGVQSVYDQRGPHCIGVINAQLEIIQPNKFTKLGQVSEQGPQSQSYTAPKLMSPSRDWQ